MANIDTFLGSALSKLTSMKVKSESEKDNNQEIIEYLYTLTEQLRYVLGHLEDDNFTEGTLQKIVSDNSGDTYSSLEMDLSGIRARVAAAEGDISTLELTAQGLNVRVGTQESITTGLNSAQQTQLTFNSSGLTINNGGFKIKKSGSDVFYVDNSGNLTLIGQLMFKSGGTNKGGFYYSTGAGGLVACADKLVVNNTAVSSGTEYLALLASDSLGGALRIKEATKAVDMVRAGVNSGNYGYVSVRTGGNVRVAQLEAGAYGGAVNIYNISGALRTHVGGEISFYNDSGYLRAQIGIDGQDMGILMLKNSIGYDCKIYVAPGVDDVKYCSCGTHDFVNQNNSGYAAIYCSVVREMSDRNLKKDFADISSEQASTFVMGLKPQTFGFKNEEEGKHWGFVAQDVKELVDDMGEEFSGYQEKALGENTTCSLAYTELIAPMVKVIQDQERRIKALEDKQWRR